jgi:ABC-type nitrate/sulfonate/bicarbonate transport system permease component
MVKQVVQFDRAWVPSITAPGPLKIFKNRAGQRTRTDIGNVQGRKLHMKKTLTAAVVGLSLAAVGATALHWLSQFA